MGVLDRLQSLLESWVWVSPDSDGVLGKGLWKHSPLPRSQQMEGQDETLSRRDLNPNKEGRGRRIPERNLLVYSVYKSNTTYLPRERSQHFTDVDRPQEEGLEE